MIQESADKNNPKNNNPNVIIPPPFIVFAAIIIGVGIGWVYPIHFLPASLADYSIWIGGALILLAIIIGPGLSFREFRKAKTPIGPDDTVLELVTTGPFRYSRNPMYLTLLVLQIGTGILTNNAWIEILVVPVVIWMREWAIKREERYMIQKFGQAYLSYQAKVRRWL